MKKTLLLLLCLVMATCLFTACKKRGDDDTTTTTAPPSTTTSTTTTTTTTAEARYMITYVSYGGTNNEANPTVFKPLEGSVTLLPPTKDYYVFDGWYDNFAMSGNPVTVLNTAVQSDLTLYAKWTPVSYQIKYTLYTNGQVSEDAPRNFTVESGAITLPTTATRPGYDFGGWYPNNKFTAGTELTEVPAGTTGDFTVYAKWLPRSYDITYVLNDGTNDLANPDSYQTGGMAVTLRDPTRAGYTFIGWYTTERFAAGTSMSKVLTAGAKNLTLYARWMQSVEALIEFPVITAVPTTLPENPPAVEVSQDANFLVNAQTTHVSYSYGSASNIVRATAPNTLQYPLMTSKPGDSDSATNKALWIRWATQADWTDYSYLTFALYSANATGAKVGIVLYAGSDKIYLRADFFVNWTGWKVFRIGTSDFAAASGARLENVTHARMTGFGWDYNMPEHTYLALGNMYLSNDEPKYTLNPATLTAADFDAVKARWKEMLIGNETLNANNNTAKSRAESVGASAANLLASINTAPDTTALFSGLNYTDVTQIQTAYERLQTMARGWATPGSSMYHNADLLNAIKFGLQWLYSYDTDPTDGYVGVFGDNVQHAVPGNWWNWRIGIPMPLTETILLLEDVLQEFFIQQILEPVDHLVPLPTMTLANRAWLAKSCLLSAVIQNDGERTVEAMNALLDVYNLVESGDGFYADGSYIQHVALGYTGGYGVSYMGMMNTILYAFNDTPFDPDDALDTYIDQLFEQFFNAFEPLIYDGVMAAAMTGRSFGSNTQTGVISSLFQLVDYASPALRTRFLSLLKYYEQVNSEYVNLSVNYVALTSYAAYKADTTIQARTGYINAKIFGGMDRVVQHAENYSVVLSLSSTRVYRYEAINGANSNGWYLGDGVTYVYGSNQNAYSHGAMVGLDRLRMPGITVSAAPRTDQQFTVYSNPYNGNPFVGGVSDGVHAVAVMKAQYFNSTFFTNFSSDLLAHKSWFMFDDELVCLGSNITATDFDEILTMIDNRYISAADVLKINGEAYTLTTSAAVREDVSYITLENFGGYYFPDSPTLTLMDKTNASNNHYLHLWVSHGQLPKAAAYMYVMLPEKSEAEVAAYAATPDIQVLRNDMMISAVRETTLDKTGYAFWYAYNESFFDGLMVNRPCTVLKTENENGSLTFHVSDPSHRLSEVVLTLDGVYDVVS
ncbi:MAG: polysaccharide lyase family 8 super-sandwich domain-containing protein, partial [Eubacteriales bacterium]